MKRRILQILGVAAIATIGMVSCDTDPCKDVDCGLYGECVDGDCECDLGYEGVACATESRADFIGSYLINEESCDVVNKAASIAASSTGANKIAISNFGDFACGGTPIVVIATVLGNDVTVDANQSFCSGDIVINSGSGSINASGTVVTITYSSTFGGSTGSCTTVFTPL